MSSSAAFPHRNLPRSPVAVPSRRTERSNEARRGDDRELALLKAARSALLDGTFERLSISDLAAAASLTRPTFYFYFASKDALLATLVEQVLVEIQEGLEVASHSDSDLSERIREAVERVAAAWQRHGEILCAAVELSTRLPQFADLWSTAVRASVEPFLSVIEAADATRDVDRLRRQARLLAWAQERNLYLLRKADGNAAAFAALTEDLIEMWGVALHPPSDSDTRSD
ncbi:TetR/AcrR family transcriptional regulator [Nocardia nova]|uniref:TetR/AcrR family transcriptional regulator n=1 Tax=Nocardia nova TaxID=37330 RepID=UPI003401DBA5